MSTENREVAYLKDKPLSEDYAYVYGELEDGSIVKISKEQLGIEQLKENVTELNSNLTNQIAEISKKLGITILHDSDYPYYKLSILGRAYTKDNATTYGFTIKYGNSTVGKWSGDTYYISVSHDGKMLVGVQINSAARPTWYEK